MTTYSFKYSRRTSISILFSQETQDRINQSIVDAFIESSGDTVTGRVVVEPIKSDRGSLESTVEFSATKTGDNIHISTRYVGDDVIKTQDGVRYLVPGVDDY